MAGAKKTVGRAEWDVLQHIADTQPTGVREVAEHMARDRGLARTSVLTVMERLRAKGFLRRVRQENRWIYSLTEKKSELVNDVVHDFVENTLQGTVSPFIAYLAEKTELTEEQVDQLKSLVRNLEAKPAKGKKVEKKGRKST